MTVAGTLQITAPTEREIVMTRVFNAPRTLVFDAWTKPELIKRWFGPRDWTLIVCEVDLRVGGHWRYVMRKNTGVESDYNLVEMGMQGIYQEITPPARLVYTEEFDDGAWPERPGEAIITMLFVEHAGQTTLTETVLYPTQAIRDAVLNSGFDSGVAEAYDRLEEYLASVA